MLLIVYQNAVGYLKLSQAKKEVSLPLKDNGDTKETGCNDGFLIR